MTCYTAVARRSDGWWAVDVPAIPGARSQARRLDHVEAMAREVIGLLLDADPDSFEIDVEVDLPEQVRQRVDAVGRARADADDAAQLATGLTGRTALDLRDQLGLSMRDIGRLLGISHQRVAQLLNGQGPIAV